ncbi:MAG TPA: serine/threonine-protein kinase [Patescibacteria group bacterium]|nr:serine/threonine-protein kinase [Patescibacteria group bacterium]
MNATETLAPDARDGDDRTELIALTRTVAGQDGAPAVAVEPGARFGRYRIRTPLGHGGMGVVYLAEQTEPVQREVAIKVMTVGRFSPEHRLRFEIERQSLAHMNHPGIAQILDAGATPEGALYFVMEHVHGERFDRWCERRGAPLEQRIDLLRDACRAVAHAHAKGVLHCDLKPSNLLVAEIDGRPGIKLIDFGIARSLGDGHHDVAGTPGYMSPEQCETGALDTRSDVFSLGVLLFEAATDRRYRAWAADELVALAEAREHIAREAAKPPIAIEDGGERFRELLAIARRALAPSRDDRYSGADALADELDRWLQKRPVRAVPGGGLYALRCFVRRNTLLSGAVTVFAVVSALLVWRLAEQLAETRRERDTADQVTGLMLDTFSAADPYAHPGGSISARDLLRSAAADIGTRAIAPEVRVRVLGTLGEVQSRLELFADSAESFAIAAKFAADARLRLRLQVAQAQALMNAEDFAAATALADAALTELPVSAAADRADALLVRAEIGEYTEDLARARSLLAEADPLVAQADDPELHHRLQRLLGRVVLAGGDADAAVTHLSAAHDTARGHFGEQDLRTLDTLSDLAVARAQAGDFERSEHERRAIVTLTEGIWGEDSPGLATALSNLGAILQRRGGEARLREAVDVGRRAHAILHRALGDDSMETALAANNLANVLGLVGERAAAEALHAAAVRGLEASLGGAHSHLGIALNNQARNLLRLERSAEAGPLIARAGGILAASIGTEHPRYALWRLTRAEWLLARGANTEARQEALTAQPIITARFAADSPEAERLRALLVAAGG